MYEKTAIVNSILAEPANYLLTNVVLFQFSHYCCTGSALQLSGNYSALSNFHSFSSGNLHYFSSVTSTVEETPC